MEFSAKHLGEVIDQFAETAKWIDNITIEVENDLANVDTLTLLRAYEGEASVDTKLSLALAFIKNRRVHFKLQDTVLLTVENRPGVNFIDQFAEKPYLLSMLLTAAYGWMLKKLTPPSEDYTTEGGQLGTSPVPKV